MGAKTLQAPVRFGVVGVGGMGQGHCQCLKKLEEAQLTAVCDIIPAVAEKVGTEHGVPWFVKHTDLVASGLCDAITIATPHPERPPIAETAMRAGLHVLSEKPLTERVSTADAMIRTAKETGVCFVVMFQRRTEPTVIKAQELVRTGRIGKLYRATMISPEYRSQAYYDSGGWRATWRGEGGGVMMNQSPHILDVFTLLAGMPKTVIGHVETRLHNIEVEDLAEALLIYPDGGSGYLYCSTCECGPGQMIELFGDQGKLCLRGGKLQFWRFEPGVSEFTRTNTAMWGGPKAIEEEINLSSADGGHIAIMRNMVRHLLHGEPLLSPGEVGINSLELANAVWLSAHLRKPVDLPLDRDAYDKFLAGKRRKFKGQKTVKDQRITDPQHKK